MVSVEFFFDIILPVALWPLTEMNTRNISWGVKAAGAYGWQTYHLYVPTVLKSGSLNLLETSGLVQACAGIALESSWNVTVHGVAREGKWRGNWRMEWVASTLHTTSEHGLSSITTAYAHTSAASIRLNWRPLRFKWTRLFRWKTKFGFCACAIIFLPFTVKWLLARTTSCTPDLNTY
jgi:hypothetical protein